MKVLCDVSLLGWCRDGDGTTRLTGMPRSILELAARLRGAPGCEVTFGAEEWTELAMAFVASHPTFRGARLAPTRAGGGVRPETFAANEVFHTTHNAVPAGVRGVPGLAVVQTVYDMIPFVMPELFTPGDLAFYADVLARVRPDDRIITISGSAKADFCGRTGHDPARVHVTALAADQTQFQPCEDPARLDGVRARYRIPPGPYFLSLCTFEPRKNLRHVIRAFVDLVRAQPGLADLRLVLAGGTGWKFDAIFGELAAADPGVRERIIVTGFVAEDDLAPLLGGAMAFLYLSRYEGFGLPPLEAMQCGTPVVAANVSSLPEVVGDAGILLDPDDADGLCQVMLDLHGQPAWRERLSRLGRRRAERFSWERCARETVDVYRAALVER